MHMHTQVISLSPETGKLSLPETGIVHRQVKSYVWLITTRHSRVRSGGSPGPSQVRSGEDPGPRRRRDTGKLSLPVGSFVFIKDIIEFAIRRSVTAV